MDGEDQRQTMKPGGHRSDREDGEVFAEMYVHQICPQGEDRGDDCRLGSVELAKTSEGQPQAYNAGVVSKALEIRRGRWTRGQDRLDDAAPVERSGQLSSVVLHPPTGSNRTPVPTSAEAGGSNTEQSLSTLIRVCSLLLSSQKSPEEYLAAFGPCRRSILLSLGFSRVERRIYDLGTSVRNRSSTEA
jgi:hypothetical protein